MGQLFNRSIITTCSVSFIDDRNLDVKINGESRSVSIYDITEVNRYKLIIEGFSPSVEGKDSSLQTLEIAMQKFFTSQGYGL